MRPLTLSTTATAALIKNRAQQHGHLSRVAIDHFIDMQSRLRSGLVNTIQLLHPSPHGIDIGSAWRDNENTVQALHGKHAHHTGKAPSRAAAGAAIGGVENVLKLYKDILNLASLDREYPH